MNTSNHRKVRGLQLLDGCCTQGYIDASRPPAARARAGQDGGEEHRVQIISRDDAAGGSQGKGTKPEKQLNCFVRIVVLIERLGNALGTLAFTWATVILLGGYPTVLREEDDFWYATIIVFLEAARMFSKNNRTDYQVFFHTKGALRPLGWNGLIVIVYLTNIVSYLSMLVFNFSVKLPKKFLMSMLLVVLVFPTVFGIVRSSRALHLLSKPLRDAISLLSPLVATVLLVPLIVSKFFTPRSSMAKWMVLFTLLFLLVLLLTIKRLRFRRTRSKLATKHEVLIATRHAFWHRVLLNLCMFAELVMLVLMPGHEGIQGLMFFYEVLALVLVSFGNLQIPAAIVRVALSLMRLIPHDYQPQPQPGGDPNKDKNDVTNLSPSLSIFYGMVLGQGILYLAACLLGIFSFIPRRSLARRGGFRGRKAMKFVDLYYAYAWDKCMENDVLARKKISLCSFALDSINSDYSPTKQLLGVQLMHKLLKMEPSRTSLLSRLNASVETVARIIRMLDWRNPEDAAIRLFAAKVVAELAKSLRVVTVPGMIQLVSALLDADRKPKREITCALLDTDDEQEGGELVTGATSIQQEENHDLIMGQLYWDTSKLYETEACSNKEVSIDGEASSCFLRCWKWISRLWSSPHEEPPKDRNNLLLPALGMSILNSLAYCDSDNCVEISRAADLIPKIIEFTYHKNFIENTNETQQKILLGSSLKLLRRLSNTGGETGITLRRKISEHPILLRNLTDILNDINGSSLELRKLAPEILRNLAVDGNTSQEIGRIRVVITRLVDAFRSQDSKQNSSESLEKVAGQALAMLTMECANNCTAILMESRDFIEEIASMICRNKHKYVAASLLQNLFLHTQVDFSNSELRKLCETMSKVLETIMDPKTDKPELEVLIGLSSQICRAVPEAFTQELEKNNSQAKEPFIKKLVNTLKENVNPAVDCPGLRRAVIGQAIHLMKHSSSTHYYTVVFKQHGMEEALVTVEQTPSRVERFGVFVGNVGLMEHEKSVADLVAEAKELMC